MVPYPTTKYFTLYSCPFLATNSQDLICLVDKKTGKKSKTRFVKQDQVCIARLQAAGTICMETFKDFPQMGRFTLRDEGKTIAIGKVLKLVPEKD